MENEKDISSIKEDTKSNFLIEVLTVFEDYSKEMSVELFNSEHFDASVLREWFFGDNTLWDSN